MLLFRRSPISFGEVRRSLIESWVILKTNLRLVKIRRRDCIFIPAKTPPVPILNPQERHVKIAASSCTALAIVAGQIDGEFKVCMVT